MSSPHGSQPLTDWLFANNNDAPADRFSANDVFFEVVPGIWIEVLEPDHPAFEQCTNFVFEG